MTVVFEDHKARRKKQPRQSLLQIERTGNFREHLQKTLPPKTAWTLRNTKEVLISDSQYSIWW